LLQGAEIFGWTQRAGACRPRIVLAIAFIAAAGVAVATPSDSAPAPRAADCAGLTPTIKGSKGDDRGADKIKGTAANDVISAGAGNDVVSARAGDDALCGGPGKDKLKGGPGADTCDGGPGKDKLKGCELTGGGAPPPGPNNAPTDIGLSNSSVDENEPAGTTVGNFSTVDPDAGDTHTYSLIAGPGSTDNGSFSISGDQLKTTAGFDFETQPSLSVRVRTTDGDGLGFEKQFAINVSDRPDPAVAASQSVSTLEDAPKTITLSATDNDGPAADLSFAIETEPAHGSLGAIGSVTCNHQSPNVCTADVPYTPAVNYAGPDSFAFTANDGLSDSAPGTVSIDVTPVNDPPIADDENFDGVDTAVANTALVVDDPGDGPPALGGPKKSISGDILAGDTDPDGDSLAVQPVSQATNDGGVVTIQADGDFTFAPAAATSCSDHSDFFDYTVSDQNPVTPGTDTGRVTIAIAGCVWYVSNSAAGNSGTSSAPFDTVAQAETASGANDSVFVFDGDNTSTGYGGDGYAMNSGERLIGEHEGFAVDPDGGGPVGTATLLPANPGAHPTLTATNADVIDLDDGNEVRGMQIDPQGTGGGIGGSSGDSGGGTIDDVNIVDAGTPGAQPGLELDSTTGTFGISNLVINTTTAAGLRATNSGTITVQGSANTIDTTTGTVLHVANTDIGAGGLTFRRISSNGAANGINLNNTGSAGGLSVTGNGGTCTSAGTCTGGAIQNSTAAGIDLTSVGGGVSLTRMSINNGGDDGIRGSTVNGLDLTNLNVAANGNAVGESGIEVTQLTGSGSIADTAVSGSGYRNVDIANTSGALTAFGVTNSAFTATNSTTGDDGFHIENNGVGSMATNIIDSTFTDNRADHFQAATDALATGTIDVTLSTNTLTTTTGADPNVTGGGITLTPNGSADLTFEIDNNAVQQAFDDAIEANLGGASTGAASMIGTISNNTIGSPADVLSGSESASDINVASSGAGTATVSVTGNEAYQYAFFGILLNKGGSSTMDATVTGNTVENPGTLAVNGLRADSGATAGDSGTMCAALTGNSVAASGTMGNTDIRLRQRFNTTIKLPGYAGASNDTAAVNAFAAGNNPGADVSSVHNVGSGGGGFIGGTPCATPP